MKGSALDALLMEVEGGLDSGVEKRKGREAAGDALEALMLEVEAGESAGGQECAVQQGCNGRGGREW